MKGEKELHKLYAKQLQKQMDDDYVEMMKQEQTQNYEGGRTAKVHPAYEGGDVFEDLRLQRILKTQHNNEMERREQSKFIQPDKDNVIVVMPND